jgi:hypothetical protein
MNLTPSVSVRVERVLLLDPSPGFVPGVPLPMTHEDIVFNRKGGVACDGEQGGKNRRFHGKQLGVKVVNVMIPRAPEARFLL